jgi:hypothetical protein
MVLPRYGSCNFPPLVSPVAGKAVRCHKRTMQLELPELAGISVLE